MIKGLVLAVLAVVLISGCIGQTPTPVVTNDGLKITSFEATPTTQQIGKPVVFRLRIDNVGAVTARNITVWLSGIEGSWKNPDGSTVISSSKAVSDLYGADPTTGQPGGMDFITWTYLPPDQAPGLKVPREVEAFVVYNYKTTGSLQTEIISRDFFQIEYGRKGLTPPGQLLTNTPAPVQLALPSGMENYYITIDDPTTSKPIVVDIMNVGSGFPLSPVLPGRLTGTLRLSGPGGVRFSECLGARNTTVVYINATNVNIAALSLSGGRSTIACNVVFDPGFMLTRDKITVSFDLDYRYYIRQPITVDVSSMGA